MISFVQLLLPLSQHSWQLCRGGGGSSSSSTSGIQFLFSPVSRGRLFAQQRLIIFKEPSCYSFQSPRVLKLWKISDFNSGNTNKEATSIFSPRCEHNFSETNSLASSILTTPLCSMLCRTLLSHQTASIHSIS